MRRRCQALPGGRRDSLPVGLQVVGQRWRDDTVLRIGRAVELTNPDSSRRPAL
ncbi:MAG TPA: hypothetical protein VJT78_09040 [Candidatus Dormibacteraeota bacterium]|nr:hypothetical protein [Candidatus Dormibacteraeota bacterium]